MHNHYFELGVSTKRYLSVYLLICEVYESHFMRVTVNLLSKVIAHRAGLHHFAVGVVVAFKAWLHL